MTSVGGGLRGLRVCFLDHHNLLPVFMWWFYAAVATWIKTPNTVLSLHFHFLDFFFFLSHREVLICLKLHSLLEVGLKNAGYVFPEVTSSLFSYGYLKKPYFSRRQELLSPLVWTSGLCHIHRVMHLESLVILKVLVELWIPVLHSLSSRLFKGLVK